MSVNVKVDWYDGDRSDLKSERIWARKCRAKNVRVWAVPHEGRYDYISTEGTIVKSRPPAVPYPRRDHRAQGWRLPYGHYGNLTATFDSVEDLLKWAEGYAGGTLDPGLLAFREPFGVGKRDFLVGNADVHIRCFPASEADFKEVLKSFVKKSLGEAEQSPVKSILGKAFGYSYAKLDDKMKKDARETYQAWIKDPWSPGFDFHPLKRADRFWSVRLGRGFRAVAERTSADTYEFFWVGSHPAYEKLLSRLSGHYTEAKQVFELIHDNCHLVDRSVWGR